MLTYKMANIESTHASETSILIEWKEFILAARAVKKPNNEPEGHYRMIIANKVAILCSIRQKTVLA